MALASTALCCCAMLCAVTGLSAVSTTGTPYSPPVLNSSYVSDSNFNPRGLQPIYNAVTSFLRGIQERDPLPPDMLEVRDGKLFFKLGNPGAVVNYYGGVVAIVVFGLLAALLVPVVALVWSCCSCCGGGSSSAARRPRKGTRQKDHSDYGMEPQQHIQEQGKASAPRLAPITLGLITCVVLVFAVISFTTNAYMSSGIDGLGDTVSAGLQDMQLYLDNANVEVNTILDVNYGELSEKLSNVLEGCRDQTTTMVTNITSSLPLDTLTKMAAGLETVNTGLNEVLTETQSMVATGENIVSEMQSVQTALNSKCGSNCPAELISFISSLPEPSFPELPVGDVRKSIESVNDLVTSDFKEKLSEGRRLVGTLSDKVEDQVQKVMATTNEAVAKTGSSLRARASELVNQVAWTSDSFRDVDHKVQQYQNEYVKPNEGYRNIGFIVGSVILLVIAVLSTIGLVCGCCTRRQSYGFLSFSVWLILSTFSLLIIIVTILFVVGLVADRACEVVRSPEGNQIIGIIDQLVEQKARENTSSPGIVYNISNFITECHRNKPLYEVLNLDPTVNIDQVLNYTGEFSFDEYLRKIEDTANEIVQVKLIDSVTQGRLADLEGSDLSKFNFTTFKEKISGAHGELNKLNATNVVTQLQNIARSTGLDFTTELTVLENVAKEVDSMGPGLTSLSGQIDKLELDTKLGYSSLSEAVQTLLHEVNRTQGIIEAAGPNFIQVANSTATSFLDEVQDYLNFVVNRVRKDSLPCGPLSGIYNATVVATCDRIVAPWNGFWASAGCCLLLFIPTAILAAYLSSRRRK